MTLTASKRDPGRKKPASWRFFTPDKLENHTSKGKGKDKKTKSEEEERSRKRSFWQQQHLSFKHDKFTAYVADVVVYNKTQTE